MVRIEFIVSRGCRVASRAMTLGSAGGLLACLGLLLIAGCAQVDREDPVSPAERSISEAASKAAPVKKATKPSRRVVREIQDALNSLGYPVGNPDGILGRRTREALKTFQKNEGVGQGGRISKGVLGRLRYRKAQQPDPEPKDESLYAAFPPVYEVGSSFVYSDGRVETVTGVKGDLVRWVGQDGSRFTTHRSFFLPMVYWEAADQSGSSSLNTDPSSLWLQDAGQRASFTALTTVMRRDGRDDIEEKKVLWTCRALKREKISATVGTFETLKVLCESSPGTVEPRSRTWHYARGLRHYLQHSESSGQGPAVELIAIRPGTANWPPIARAALGRAIERALDTMIDGQAFPWSSTGVDARVTIAVDNSFEGQGGATCRTFFQLWSDGKGKRRYPGVACRDADGEWTIPGLIDRRGKTTAIAQWMS